MEDRIVSLDGLRALENPITNVQLIDPVITDLVLGQPVQRRYPGERILPRKMAPAYRFGYRRNDNSHIVHHNTERPMRSPIRLGDQEEEKDTATLRRFSFGTLRDVDEIVNASSELRIREKSAAFGRRIVNLDIEYRRSIMLQDPASYAVANVLAIPAGLEWDSGNGDMRANIRTVLSALQASTGIPWDEWTGWASGSTFHAMLQDSVFLSQRANYSTDTPDAGALARFVGMKEIWTSTPMIAPTKSSAAVPMYGDVFIIYYDGGAQDLDAEFGDIVFGHTFSWNGGVASTPFYDDIRTSWVFPWTDYALPLLLSANAGGLITNTAE